MNGGVDENWMLIGFFEEDLYRYRYLIRYFFAEEQSRCRVGTSVDLPEDASQSLGEASLVHPCGVRLQGSFRESIEIPRNEPTLEEACS